MPMCVTKETSEKFELMGFISAICVVFLHMGVPATEGSSGWWLYEIMQVLCWFSVPFFFLAAGFFLAGHIGEDGWYRHQTLKRVRTILVPFLVWSTIWWMYLLAMGLLGDLISGRPIGEHYAYLFEVKTLMRMSGLDVFHPPLYNVVWFLRALFFLVLLSPCIERLTRKTWMVVVFLLLEAAYRLYSHLLGPFNGFFDSVIPIRGLGWFALGVALRFRRIVLPSPGKWVGMLSLAIAVGLSIVSAQVGFRAFFMLLATPFMMGFFWLVAPPMKLHLILKASTFPIYLLHSFFISAYCLLIDSSTDNCLVMLSRVVWAIVASVGLSVILRKTVPQMSALLFGGR